MKNCGEIGFTINSWASLGQGDLSACLAVLISCEICWDCSLTWLGTALSRAWGQQGCASSAGSPSRAASLTGSSFWSLLLHLVFGEEPNSLIVLMGYERQDGVLLQSS